MQFHSHVLSFLLKLKLPKLDKHFARLGISWEYFVVKFVQTLCGCIIPTDYLIYFYDSFFIVSFFIYQFFGRTAGLDYIRSLLAHSAYSKKN